MRYYYKYTLNSPEQGPVDKEQLRGVISVYGTFVRREEEETWAHLEELPELAELVFSEGKTKSSRNPTLGASIMKVLGIVQLLVATIILISAFAEDGGAIPILIAIATIVVGLLFLALSSHFRNTADIRSYLKRLSEKE